jgi:hypothetical protein
MIDVTEKAVQIVKGDGLPVGLKVFSESVPLDEEWPLFREIETTVSNKSPFSDARSRRVRNPKKLTSLQAASRQRMESIENLRASELDNTFLIHYSSGGVPFHVDGEDEGTVVASENIGTDRVLRLRRRLNGELVEAYNVLLRRRWAYVLTEYSRYQLEHGFWVGFDSPSPEEWSFDQDTFISKDTFCDEKITQQPGCSITHRNTIILSMS